MSLYIKDSTQDSKKRPAAGLYDGAGKGGNADAVILTKEEYDALPDTKLTDNKQYFVKDWSQGGGSTFDLNEFYPSDNNIEHQIGDNLYRMHFSGILSTEYLVLDDTANWITEREIIDASCICRKSNGQIINNGYIASGWRSAIHVNSSGNLDLVTGSETRGTYDAYVTYRKKA